ncbi:glutamyl-tRNA synthetase [Gautieria morchelliformis]|nr:glutamyl-tRNA synthetase [Gautieria morchelliformis]
MVLLRFAPSPTGALHLGGLRTALLNYLVAKKLDGKWILRIEDTDTARTVPGSVDNIRHALDWAGLHYDYGPGLGGPHGSYFQSQRLDLYRSFANKLLDARHAYRCFCSPTHLSETKERLHKTGSSATYDRTCLHLTEEEVARRVKSGERSVIRLHDGSVPARTIPSDLVFGHVRDAHLSLPTDPILLKSDYYPTYHLASVVDDSQMGITHVLRGEEWLPSLPLHLDLYSCLSIDPPQFAHLPLLLNADGSKMSKRNGDVQVGDYIAKGWEPEAVLNWLALVGWGKRLGDADGGSKLEVGKSVPHVFTLAELESKFDLSALTSRRGALDPSVLRHVNKEHIKLKTSSSQQLAKLVHKTAPIISAAFPHSDLIDDDYIGRVILTLAERLGNAFDIPTLAPYFFVDPDWSTDVAQRLKASVSLEKYERSITRCILSLEEVKPADWNHEVLAALLRGLKYTLAYSSKELMTPLRHAITGMKDGPSVALTLETLGKERTLARLRRCIHA